MTYFSEHYVDIRYPITTTEELAGLRKAQLGAIHAIAAHFITHQEPALIVMPTGSGKTAVLMMSAFIERSERVLVVTPSRLVRNQITENFLSLNILKQINVLPKDIPSPKVTEVENKITSAQEWENLRLFDVIISTPNSISPEIAGIPIPPKDLFDLIIIDEAHHSPAKIWNEILSVFKESKCILFTATPFRRDKQEIRGRMVFNYPIRHAYQDKIFGEIKYLPVNPIPGAQNDIILAREAEIILHLDREMGLNHFIMVRTDSKKRANELKRIYSDNTTLNLRLIHSDQSYKYIKKSILELRDKKLDGIICVNMLGEGFDFPNLKIAVIHSPHKSLAVTLQFIGRFARVGDNSIGTAKFLAVPSEIEIEAKKLYEDGAVWQELIANLIQGRIQREEETREILEKFEDPVLTEEITEDLSLYSLNPYCHVKIYRVTEDVDVTKTVKFPDGIEIVFCQPSIELSASVFIIKETKRPRWTHSKEFDKIEYDLVIVYYHRDSRLLFINASRGLDVLYEKLADQYSGKSHKILPLSKINSILSGLQNFRFFNIGMKNRQLNSNTESYRIITGSSAQDAITASDGLLYNRGHIFGKAEEDDQLITLGYSSSSKVWSNHVVQIPDILDWCDSIASKILTGRNVTTESGLDFLGVGSEITELPDGVIAVDWNSNAYKKPIFLDGIISENGERISLVDLDLEIDRTNTNNESIRVIIRSDNFDWSVNYSLSSEQFFNKVEVDQRDITLIKGEEKISLDQYLNNYPLNFYFADFSRLTGSEYFNTPMKEPELFDKESITLIDWAVNRIDITKEFYKRNDVRGEFGSIHDFMRGYLNNDENQLVIYDHRTGEIADFISMCENDEKIVISLFHCKKSSETNPGDRVGDIYEVSGQVVKSLNWLYTIDGLHKKLKNRLRGGSVYIKGDGNELERLFSACANKRVIYQVGVVQPGISKARLSNRNAIILASANEYLRNAKGENMLLLASE